MVVAAAVVALLGSAQGSSGGSLMSESLRSFLGGGFLEEEAPFRPPDDGLLLGSCPFPSTSGSAEAGLFCFLEAEGIRTASGGSEEHNGDHVATQAAEENQRLARGEEEGRGEGKEEGSEGVEMKKTRKMKGRDNRIV